jgi:4-hydroxybenzoate polyprenyltransferase/phosphoserine phosphatase
MTLSLSDDGPAEILKIILPNSTKGHSSGQSCFEILMSAPPVLVVDLDGTLVKSDMLFETFWAAATKNWCSACVASVSLLSGRAALKARLARLAQLDFSLLPYNPDVLAFIAEWRRGGGRTVLVTAADQLIADAVALQLGIFDEVHGSDGTRNLKGRDKANFLTQRFGKAAFDYMGDAAVDIPVWRVARRAIVVNASTRLLEQVKASCGPAVALGHQGTHWPAAWRAMRPHQWVKNLLLLLPILAAHTGHTGRWQQALFALVAFSLVTSSVYLLNDLFDLSADRQHSRKKDRPLASGNLSLFAGTLMAPTLLLAGFAVGALATEPLFLLTLSVYYFLTLAYSMLLKRMLVIDICTLAGLYSIRVVAGGAATGIHLSVWLLAFSMFIFLSLAAMKRQAELVDSSAQGLSGAVGRAYRVDDLPIVSMIAIAAGYMAVLVLALYVSSPEVQVLYTRPELLWAACPILLYWVSRMALIAHRGEMNDDPILFVTRDRVGLLCVAGICIVAVMGAVL